MNKNMIRLIALIKTIHTIKNEGASDWHLVERREYGKTIVPNQNAFRKVFEKRN